MLLFRRVRGVGCVATYEAWRFKAAMRRFAADPEGALVAGSAMLAELVSAWGNAGWSAHEEYLRSCLEQALQCNGPTLECGSGLSTLLLGVVAERRGFEHWALEHQPAWSARVEQEAARHGLHRVHVCTVPCARTVALRGTTHRWHACHGNSQWWFATGHPTTRWVAATAWCR